MRDKAANKSRRSFLDWMLGSGLAALAGSVLYPLFRFVIPPESAEAQPNAVVAAKVDELSPNSGKVFRFGSKPAILIRTPEGELRAFTAVCTHLQCTVQYREDFRHIWCACHNGHFDLYGTNIAGPPPSPLERYEARVVDDEVHVSRAQA